MQRFGRKAETPEVTVYSQEFWPGWWSVPELCPARGHPRTDSLQCARADHREADKVGTGDMDLCWKHGHGCLH